MSTAASPPKSNCSNRPEPAGPEPGASLWTRLRHGARFFRDPIATVTERFERFGDTYCVHQRQGGRLFVTRDPACIADILVTSGAAFGKGHSAFQMLSEVLGDSLLISDGDTWRRQRRLVQPAFSRARLGEYAEAMVRESVAAADGMAGPQAREVDVAAVVTELTLAIVARTLFGQQLRDGAKIARAMHWLNEGFARPDLLPAWMPTLTRLRVRRAKTDLDEVVYGLIEHRRNEVEKSATRPQDLLQRLLDARDEEGDGRGLSDQEVRDQLVTLYLAGHDTTSHAVSWTLYLLASHPEAMAKVQGQIEEVLRGKQVSFEDLPALDLVDAAFKEAMRLYPPAVAIPRRASSAGHIGEYPVDKGDEAIIWTYIVHRDGRHFKDPDNFVLDRFKSDQEPPRHKYSYLPFGAGQRVCVGQMFATFEAQIILTTLLQRFNFTYDRPNPPEQRFGVTLAPKGGLPLVVNSR